MMCIMLDDLDSHPKTVGDDHCRQPEHWEQAAVDNTDCALAERKKTQTVHYSSERTESQMDGRSMSEILHLIKLA